MEKRVEQQKLLFLSMCSSSDRNKIIVEIQWIFMTSREFHIYWVH